MKKYWLVLMTFVGLNIGMAGMGATLAQEVPLAGGYAEASVNDSEVRTAARFAIQAREKQQGSRLSLISIERAETQVVAGLNYRLRLKVKGGGRTQDVTAVVYKDLRQRFRLTSWEVADGQAGRARSDASGMTIEQLVKALADAYTSRSLGTLDAERPYLKQFRIVIEHSLADDTSRDRFRSRQFKSLADGERWLRSMERGEDGPIRESRPLIRCARGVCTYDFDGGILHNHLYLRKVSYIQRNGRAYIRTIYLLDGD